ncbi:MAG: hypothetical protein IIA45_15835 [Bacteroidetes bacterium]|nr:hypothetical protein [Bacteroidota bacterium]
MDPNLFHVDLERLFEVLVAIVLLSFVVERFLSVFFESHAFIKATKDKKGIKEFIALALSITVCFYWEIDVLTIAFASNDEMTIAGKILSGGLVAGGSKASIKLFRDLMGFASRAQKQHMGLLPPSKPSSSSNKSNP